MFLEYCIVGNFRKFCKFRRFVAKVFSVKIAFFTANSRKFSPSKVSQLYGTISTGHTHRMVDILLSESRLVEGLKGLGISPSDFQDILHLPVLSQHRTFAVDMRNESVVVSTVQYQGCSGNLGDDLLTSDLSDLV